MLCCGLLHNRQLEHLWNHSKYQPPSLIYTPNLLFQDPTSTANKEPLLRPAYIFSPADFMCIWVSRDFSVIIVVKVLKCHTTYAGTLWDASLPNITLTLSNSSFENLWQVCSFCHVTTRVPSLESKELPVDQLYHALPSLWFLSLNI